MPGNNVGGLRWNPTLARYIDERGRMIPRRQVQAALDASLTNAHGRATALAGRLASGSVSLEEWEAGMRGLIKDVHIWSAAGAVGGWDQLGPAEFGRIGQAVRTQYEYLYGFAQDIASGKQALTGVAARSTLYVEAGRTTAEAQALVTEGDAGYDEERNVSGSSDPCRECPALSARGWVPIGTTPLPGNRQCGKRCKCRMERRISDAGRANADAKQAEMRQRTRDRTTKARARRAR